MGIENLQLKISIVGIVGVPAKYGGFETLVDNLVRFHSSESLDGIITIFCSAKNYPSKESRYLSARLKYLPLQANGVQSIPYDLLSLVSAVWNRNDVILLLGVSGAIVLPFVRLFSSARIITNIDGIEWRREKWQGVAKHFLRFSEKMALRFSHDVIADNGGIADYVKQTYGVDAHVIAYGGDHALAVEAVAVDEFALPAQFAFSVCRIEPENNIQMVLEAFAALKSHALVIVGNWNNSDYGRILRKKYASCSNLSLLDPIYDLGKLKTLRSHASHYVHGHSAGGTNPSLVEAMYFGKPVLAFDCSFNRSTTEDGAFFFKNSATLAHVMETMDATEAETVGRNMLEIALRRYSWRIVAQQYFTLLGTQTALHTS